MVMTIPRNVSRFEILMYLSLLVIVVSGGLVREWRVCRHGCRRRVVCGSGAADDRDVVVQHSSGGAQKDELGAVASSDFAGVWCRVAFGFAGLYFAFTDDAKDWFRSARIR
jgi:hypothetical protein